MDFGGGNVLGQSFGFQRRMGNDGIGQNRRRVFGKTRALTKRDEFGSVFGGGLARIAQMMQIGDAEDLPGPRVVIADQLAILRSVGDAVQIEQIERAGLSPQHFLDRAVIRRAADGYTDCIERRGVLVGGGELGRGGEHDLIAKPLQRLHVAENNERTRIAIGAGNPVIDHQSPQRRSRSRRACLRLCGHVGVRRQRCSSCL